MGLRQTLRQRLATWFFGKEIQQEVQAVVSQRDELWARAIYDSLYREGGHAMVGGMVTEWNPIGLPGGIFFEPDWGMIWRPKPGEPYTCPVRVVSQAELGLAVHNVFKPKEREESDEDD